jgi:hypothetical protein
MQRLVCVLVVLASCFAATTVCSQESCSPQKSKAVEDYLRTCPVDDLLDQMALEIIKQIPKENQRDFAKVWMMAVNKAELTSVASRMLCSHFTLEELKALATFYGSPEGKSIIKKMPKYAADLMPYMVHVGNRAKERAMELLRQEEIERKSRSGT